MRLDDPTLKVLNVILSKPKKDWYGLEISREAKVGNGTIYPMLFRLEKAGFLEAYEEQIDEVKEGRKARKYYKFTGKGIPQLKEEVEKKYTILQSVKRKLEVFLGRQTKLPIRIWRFRDKNGEIYKKFT